MKYRVVEILVNNEIRFYPQYKFIFWNYFCPSRYYSAFEEAKNFILKEVKAKKKILNIAEIYL